MTVTRLLHGLSGLAVVGSLACFFLPWMMVSCGDQISTPTGWQVAVGGTIETNMEPQEANGHLFVFLAFVVGVVILLMALWGVLRGPRMPRDAIIIAILCGYALVAMLGFFLRNQTDLTGDVAIIVEYKPAFFGTALGYGLAMFAAMIHLAVYRPPPKKSASAEVDTPDTLKL